MTITAKNVTVSVCLKELPFDVSICNITDSNDREILDKYYNVKVTNGTINEKVGKENENVNQIDAYGMVDNQEREMYLLRQRLRLVVNFWVVSPRML